MKQQFIKKVRCRCQIMTFELNFQMHETDEVTEEQTIDEQIADEQIVDVSLSENAENE